MALRCRRAHARARAVCAVLCAPWRGPGAEQADASAPASGGGLPPSVLAPPPQPQCVPCAQQAPGVHALRPPSLAVRKPPCCARWPCVRHPSDTACSDECDAHSGQHQLPARLQHTASRCRWQQTAAECAVEGRRGRGVPADTMHGAAAAAVPCLCLGGSLLVMMAWLAAPSQLASAALGPGACACNKRGVLCTPPWPSETWARESLSTAHNSSALHAAVLSPPPPCR
jgi:hypothetical protein